jgi:disulfide bond formation protein DsbB
MKQRIEYFQVPRHLAIAVAAVSAAALAAAYMSQYGFGLKPCILCLYQRVPYFANIALGALAFTATFRYPRLWPLILGFSAITFLAGAAIAGFHAGVEYGWWKGLPSCGGDILPENVSIEDLRKALTQQAIVRCDKPAWVLFGISMAGYNFAASLAFASGVIYLLRRKGE